MELTREVGRRQRVNLPRSHDYGENLTRHLLCADCRRALACHAHLRYHWRQRLVFSIVIFLLHLSLRTKCRHVRSAAAEEQLHS